MNDVYKTETLEQHGDFYKVEWIYDRDYGRPWEEEGCHGEVRQGHKDTKSPGERILANAGVHYWFYDFQGACKKARKEWGFPNKKEAAEAAENDFKLLKDWLEDKWFYCGITVYLMEEIDGELVESSRFYDSLWGISSEDSDFGSIIQDIIGDIETERNKSGD